MSLYGKKRGKVCLVGWEKGECCRGDRRDLRQIAGGRERGRAEWPDPHPGYSTILIAIKNQHIPSSSHISNMKPTLKHGRMVLGPDPGGRRGVAGGAESRGRRRGPRRAARAYEAQARPLLRRLAPGPLPLPPQVPPTCLLSMEVEGSHHWGQDWASVPCESFVDSGFEGRGR